MVLIRNRQVPGNVPWTFSSTSFRALPALSRSLHRPAVQTRLRGSTACISIASTGNAAYTPDTGDPGQVPFVHCMAIGIWFQCFVDLHVTAEGSSHHLMVAGLQHSQAAAVLQVGDQACGDAGLLGHSRSPFSELLSISQSILCTLAPAG